MKTRTMLRLENETVGLLHYYVREGIAPTVSEVIDVIIQSYGIAYAREKGIELKKLKKDANYLFELTRKPIKEQRLEKDSEIFSAMFKKENQ